jgi:mannose-1-phosphate guanylyltransferase
MLYPIIMAGGTGTRLWPVSRKNNPKQIKPFIDDDTLLQKTYKRMLAGYGCENIYITTNGSLVGMIKEQLPDFPEKNFTIEPRRRGTAAALGLALAKIYKRDKSASFVYINSDNYIKNEHEFLRVLSLAEKTLSENPEKVVLIGIKAEYPETGYGYIKMGEVFKESGADKIYNVEKFVEKPDLKTAEEYVASGKYLWDATLIVSNVRHFLNLFKKHEPKTYAHLLNCIKAIDTPVEAEVVGKEFSQMTDLAIDYVITEKEKDMIVMPANIGWSDVGNWRAIKEILSNEAGENVIKCQHIGVESTGNLIYATNKKIVGTIGLKDMIIVETEDALLVCPKNRAQDVKKIVAELSVKQFDNFL